MAIASAQGVEEARSARIAGMRPRLKLSLYVYVPDTVFIRITNLGPGVATSLDCTLSFTRRAVSGVDPNEEPILQGRAFHWHVLSPGECIELAAPYLRSGARMGLNDLVTWIRAIDLRGTVLDGDGREYRVDDVLDDPDVWWTLVQAADIRIPPEQRLA
jgi:hypothetical protein